MSTAKQICSVSGVDFSVYAEEAELYRKLNFSIPILCPEERARKMLAWRNERKLYRRSCDATGEIIVSIFDLNAKFPVYAQHYWWSDQWDPQTYAKDFDFNKSFFEQFSELFNVVPQCALVCPQSENSEYTNQSQENRDCYLIFCSGTSRECLYGMWYQGCTECLDCTYLEKSELCYQILKGKNCYSCTFSENISTCDNCHFSRNLIGCSYCVACVNLTNKKYNIFNKQYSAEEYFKVLASLELDRYSKIQDFQKKFTEFSETYPFKYYQGSRNENFSGDYLENNRNVFNSYNCRNSEYLYHCRDAWDARNCGDLIETIVQDFCLAVEGSYQNVNVSFSAKTSESHDCSYCSHCFNSHDLFACIGLRHAQYCIFNKQYSKEEYLKLKNKIIEQMRESGEYGEYFPIKYSPFAYNESVAAEYFPLTKDEVLQRGWKWKDLEESISISKVAPLSETIAEVDETILNQAITCLESGRQFKIQKMELKFHKKLNLPLPRLHHDLRHQQRMDLRNPRKLKLINCSSCKAPLESTFGLNLNKKVFCETCFQNSLE